METITLTNVEGIARKSGTDQNGANWIQFDVDTLAEQQPGKCDICGRNIMHGWLCLDGGDEVCNRHVRLT